MLGELKQRIEKMIDSQPIAQAVQESIAARHHQRGSAHPDRRRAESAHVRFKQRRTQAVSRISCTRSARPLNSVSNKITISGHTDAARFCRRRQGFSNWELSANRANASRREMVIGGMDDLKVLRVVGMSSTLLFDKSDPLNPINRRISIIVLNKKTEEAFRWRRGCRPAESEGDAGRAAGSAPDSSAAVR